MRATTTSGTLAAVFFPADPEARVIDLIEQARQGLRPGLRLYTNGSRLALLSKPRAGWALFAARANAESPCPA